MREGIAAVIGKECDMLLVDEAAHGSEAIDRFRRHRPDVTLMDLQMPGMGGVEAIAAIRSEFPAARIVVLSAYSGDMRVLRALRAGAAGYLLKSRVRRELIETVRVVHSGRKRVPPEIADQIAHHVTDDPLTRRESEVLGLVAEGRNNVEIAKSLAISYETVKIHVKNLRSKLAAKDRTHAAMLAVKRGFLEAPAPSAAMPREAIAEHNKRRCDRCNLASCLARMAQGVMMPRLTAIITA
ncbi:MAG: response regulator transcription factor [Ignavibacteriota bacterium]